MRLDPLGYGGHDSVDEEVGAARTIGCFVGLGDAEEPCAEVVQ